MSDVSIEIAKTAGASRQEAGTASDFFALLKPRVMSLVVFTGFVGIAVAPGTLHPVLAFAALLCIAVRCIIRSCFALFSIALHCSDAHM